jgi:ABC-type uncharacterized transport system ATPase subunit
LKSNSEFRGHFSCYLRGCERFARARVANFVNTAPRLQDAVALSLEGITRRFGQVMALDKASLTARGGTVHALLGENGAGKTTLMRVAFGLVQPDAGTIAIAGVPTRVGSPSAALTAGVGMVHQHFTLVPAMTVAENVALGSTGLFSIEQWSARVREISERTGLAIDPAALIADLSVGAQQRCEIVKALARNVRVLILDEPTAVLAPAESQDLLRWVRRFADEGHAVVLITHKLRDALAVADDVTVLRRGRTVLSKRVADTSESELVQAMLGQEREAAAPPSGIAPVRAITPGAASPNQPVVLALDAVTVRDAAGVNRVNSATMHVRAGELVGIAAIEGAGQREILRLLAGRLAPSAGTVTTSDNAGFVPEDRHLDALVLDAPLVDNVALRSAGARRGRMAWAALADATRSIIATYQVRAAGEYTNARNLSGGNQQKLIVGRELADAPSALIVENPTRGLDFRSATAVHDALRTARQNGAAVVMYSSDLDEVLALADRVVVVRNGQVFEVAGDREAVGQAMLGIQ